MKGHGYVILAGWYCPRGLGRVNLCCVVDVPQRHPLLADSEVGPTLLSGIALGRSGELGEPLSVDSLGSDCGSFHCCSKGGQVHFFGKLLTWQWSSFDCGLGGNEWVHHCFNFRSIVVLADGQSSCVGCCAPHGSDRHLLMTNVRAVTCLG